MARRDERNVIGLMSGTSADGVDAVLCRIAGRGLDMRARVVSRVHQPYPAVIRAEVLAVAGGAARSAAEFSALNWRVGEAFAKAALVVMRRARMAPAQIDLIGSHGQTISHRTAGEASKNRKVETSKVEVSCTWQIGEPAVIAARTGVRVVARFREADVAVGGQGAPLVPWTDYVLFRDRRQTRAVQNIGGIANVTYIPAGCGPEDVCAFDTGPGNMVIDALVAHFSRGRSHFDCGGRIAARGAIDVGLFNEWTSHPYFNRRPPKSCGREEFGESFVELGIAARRRALEPADVIATATAVTAHSIAEAYRKFLPQRARKPVVDEIIVCGGGVFNRTLMRELQRRLSTTRVRSIAEFGIAAQAKEGLSFAMLACACVDGVPDNLIAVTGAQRAVVLGQIISP